MHGHGRLSDRANTLTSVRTDIDQVLISREEIHRRIRELGEEIARDLESLGPDAEIVLVPILTGSLIFIADLMRELPLKLQLSVVTVSSYPGKSTSAKKAAIIGALPDDLAGKDVVIVDDILDSGQTISLIRTELAQRGPRSLRSCVLLRKTIPSALKTPCEYIGFDIPDEFVVGYGLDYDHFYRNLPDVCTLKREVL